MNRLGRHAPLLALLPLAACAGNAPTLTPAPTRVAPPPADALLTPGPDAENEIDPALFAHLPPQARAEMGLARGPATANATAAARARANPAGEERARKARKGGVRIASVAVLRVTGAPGKGNAELARALRLMLRKAGWPVRARPREDSMIITGKVEMGPKTPRGQKVRIRWRVKAPNGKLLGTIDQANVISSGAFDHGFGASALPIAEGAAQGIFRLVRRLQGE